MCTFQRPNFEIAPSLFNSLRVYLETLGGPPNYGLCGYGLNSPTQEPRQPALFSGSRGWVSVTDRAKLSG